MVLVGRKHRCKAHEREWLEERECKVMDSWLCAYHGDIFCPYSTIPKEKRMSSVCLSCKYFNMFQREMEEEEIADAEFFEAVERDPYAHLRGEIWE